MRKMIGTKMKRKKKQPKKLMELNPATPGLEGMETNGVGKHIMVHTHMTALTMAAIPIMAANMEETPAEETPIITGTPIISIGTRVAALSMEARDLATMTTTYTTMSTSTFASTNVIAWEITAMAMNTLTVVGVRSGRALFMRWGIHMVVIATKTKKYEE